MRNRKTDTHLFACHSPYFTTCDFRVSDNASLLHSQWFSKSNPSSHNLPSHTDTQIHTLMLLCPHISHKATKPQKPQNDAVHVPCFFPVLPPFSPCLSHEAGFCESECRAAQVRLPRVYPRGRVQARGRGRRRVRADAKRNREHLMVDLSLLSDGKVGYA